jgi:DNA-binding IclR family transcriptional regulator
MTEMLGVAALERALTIIDCYAAQDRGLTLGELSERTGFYKSTILRLCSSLQKFGYLNRLPNGRFVLGSTIFRLGQIYQRSFDIAEIVMPVMQRLASGTDLSASLWIMEHGYRVCLYRAESAERVRHMTAQVGERWPLERGGSASTILRAFSGAKGANLNKVREAAIAVSIGEFVPELAAISCPVFSAGDNLVGALSLGGFRSTFTKAALAKLKPMVLAAAKEITAALGGDIRTYKRKESAR